jgi:eukaryotic-like serine/threonine-protein kinase
VVIVPATRPPDVQGTARLGPVAVPAPMPVASDAPGPGTESKAADFIAMPAAASVKTQEPADGSVVPPAKPTAKVIALLAAESRTEALSQPQSPEPAPPAEDDNAYTLDDDRSTGVRRRSAPLVMAIAALLLVATLWALYGLLHPGSSSASAPVAARTAPIQQQPPAAQRAAATAQGSGAATVAIATPGWRVVAYTYLHEAQAQHKAETLRQRYPQLTPGVFALRGTAPYLVTLGGVMSKTDALALRNKAVQMGLPGDTYAQNYR